MIATLSNDVNIEQVLVWLEKNVGAIIPASGWNTGHGWVVKYTRAEDPYVQLAIGGSWIIEIDDEKLMTMFLLRWV